MNGTVKVWNAFASNNSSQYRLVARFPDEAKATKVADLLRALLGPHPSAEPAEERLSAHAGFDWDEFFPYGQEDDPTVAVDGQVVALYHSYCLGFPPELTRWFEGHGATEVEKQRPLVLQASVVFDRPSALELAPITTLFTELRSKQAVLAARAARLKNVWEIRSHEPVLLPWSEDRLWLEPLAYYTDGEVVMLHFPCTPDSLAAARVWLADRGVTAPVIRLCEYADEQRFRAMWAARCTGCGTDAVLRYLAPARWGVDVEQLACRDCGAMFTLASVLERAASEHVEEPPR
jgi:hypothetical protein